MKKILLLLPFLLLLLIGMSCSMLKKADTSTTAQNNTTPRAEADPSPATSPGMSGDDAEAQKIVGSYVGTFGDNKITLLITKVADGTISGRSIVGGNDRPFDGSYSVENASYVVTAREPGDNKYDGVFNFNIASTDPDKVTGTWKPNDTKRPEKSYSLDRRKFQYNPNVGNYPQASTRLLKTSDVENLAKDELQFMRNEIFARHGYCFSKKDMRQMFENEVWYVPNTVDIKGYLTDIEKKNIVLIKRYEKYADDYGDEYGR
jgi:hypothetical protein